ncbi:MAG: hypothetical protein AB1393_03080 [Candidatus Edwardsbacteria bacterium]
MSTRRSITFNDVLEIVESLPGDQRESLVEIIRHRLIEERRDRLARTIREAKAAYAKGKVKRGSVDDLMRELSK